MKELVVEPSQVTCAPPVVQAAGLTRTFVHDGRRRTVLDDVHLEVRRAEVLAVVGRSGSGKSTLLNILGLLDRPDEGTLTIDGRDCTKISPRRAPEVRSTSIGFVFQAMNLIPHLDVMDNILVGAHPAGRADRGEAHRLLEDLALGRFQDRRAAELSLGEQQRVAVIRALIKRPAVILADEPTGSLDAESETAVMALLRRAADAGSGVVVVTHSRDVAAMADRVLTMSHDGSLESEA